MHTTQTLWKSKLKAFGIHLLFSMALISSFLLIVTQIWYPDILFELENVWQGLKILVPVDTTLGPLLTLIVFVPGKKGMKGDLIVIVMLQILALIGGSFAIYQSRPEVMVFAGDRFEIITSYNFDREHLVKHEFLHQPKPYPFLVYALPGQTDEEISNFVINNVQYQKMSERYRPLINYKDKVLSKALNPDLIKAVNADNEQLLTDFSEKFQNVEFVLYPLQSTTTETRIIALKKDDLTLLGYINIDPWLK